MAVNHVSHPNALTVTTPSYLSPDTPYPQKKITYANFVCDIKLSKNETHRVRLTVRGDKLAYDGDPSSPAIRLLNLKIHLNSVISDAQKGACYLRMDIINYYLNNPMAKYQHMLIHLKDIPNEVIVE